LFSATNGNDYATFSIISCDGDGGIGGFGNMSVLFATGLTSGSTYYIAVDDDGFFSQGSFCITVSELGASMLSTNNTCASSYQRLPNNSNTNYTGWLSLLDGSSRLVAMVKNPAGVRVNDYTVSQNIHSGAARSSNGTFYLNRHFNIDHTTATDVQVKLFFLASEMSAITAADATVNLANIGVSKQSNGGSTCFATFSPANGGIVPLTQTENGSAGGANWIGFTTPGFSNFYLNKQGAALPITLVHFMGKKSATANLLSWKVNCTDAQVIFDVERSADGRHFSSIGLLTATQLRCLSPFDFADGKPVPGINYYRIKMTGVAGKFNYTNVVAINNRLAGIELIGLQPTLVQSEAVLYIAAAKAGKLQIAITDIAGRQLQLQNINVAEGENKIRVSLGWLAAGVYHISTINEAGKKTIRFVKE